VYAIPDMTNESLQSKYLVNLYPKEARIQYKDNPKKMELLSSSDLSQNYSLGPMEKSKGEKKVIHGALLGTTVILNAFENKNFAPDALILESPVMSINSAIIHKVSTVIPMIDKLPGVYYWGPYLARIFFLYYAPSGKQPIKLIDKIPKDIPILIIHPEYDTNSSIDDSRALYYHLKKSGNNNVYFIDKALDNEGWCNLLAPGIVKLFLTLHKIIEVDELEQFFDLSQYRPNHEQFKRQYETLTSREKNHERLFYVMSVTIFLSVCYVMRSHIGKLLGLLKIVRT
jgi:hypothetical protein